LAGGLQDLASEQVADLDSEILGVGEAGAPGHALGPVGMVQHIFGGGLEGGPQSIQQL
jgi:hypothetical protein